MLRVIFLSPFSCFTTLDVWLNKFFIDIKFKFFNHFWLVFFTSFIHTFSHISNFLLYSFRTPPSPMLPPGVGALYSPSASFQSLLANISAAQHQHQSVVAAASKPPPSFHAPHAEFLTSAAGSPPISPQGHPSTATNLTTTATTSSSISSGGSDGASPTDDRRSSSIAALRLKAREHELRLEMLRQNGHAPDIIS